MVAIIEVSGKQYCVEPGQTIIVDRVTEATGATLTLKDILGGNTVAATVVEHKLGDKVVSRKFRNKTRYQRTKGHRQSVSVLTIADAKQTKKAEPETKEV